MAALHWFHWCHQIATVCSAHQYTVSPPSPSYVLPMQCYEIRRVLDSCWCRQRPPARHWHSTTAPAPLPVPAPIYSPHHALPHCTDCRPPTSLKPAIGWCCFPMLSITISHISIAPTNFEAPQAKRNLNCLKPWETSLSDDNWLVLPDKPLILILVSPLKRQLNWWKMA